jgi:hypothetical protein
MTTAAVASRLEHAATLTGGAALAALGAGLCSAALGGPDLRIVSVEGLVLGAAAVYAGQRCARVWLWALLWLGVMFLVAGLAQGVLRATAPAALVADALAGGCVLGLHGLLLRAR